MADFSGVQRVWNDDLDGGTYQELLNGLVQYTRPYNQTEQDEAAARRRADTRKQNRDTLLTGILAGIENLKLQQAAMKDAYTNKTNAELTSAAAIRQILQWQYNHGDKLIKLARVVADAVDTTETE